MVTGSNTARVCIEGAPVLFEKTMRHLLGEQYKPQSEYGAIKDWITDNEGRGLLLMGNCGRGKTFIARNVIPRIYEGMAGKIVNFFRIVDITTGEKIEEVKRCRFAVLDDVGTEQVLNEYGSKRLVFDELLDWSEYSGNILIITTNLTGEQLASRYGERVMERLRSTTKRVLMQGESLRQTTGVRQTY